MPLSPHLLPSRQRTHAPCHCQSLDDALLHRKSTHTLPLALPGGFRTATPTLFQNPPSSTHTQSRHTSPAIRPLQANQQRFPYIELTARGRLKAEFPGFEKAVDLLQTAFSQPEPLLQRDVIPKPPAQPKNHPPANKPTCRHPRHKFRKAISKTVLASVLSYPFP